VVGPSGSGKSSAVRAGLIPRIRADQFEASEGWFVASLIPGSHPFEELEAALLKALPNPPPSVLEQLVDGERGVIRTIKRLLPDDQSELVLFIDQFEELFTLADDTTRDRFLRALAAVAADEGSRTRIVCTVRADYFDRPLAHPAVGVLVRDHNVAVTPLSRGNSPWRSRRLPQRWASSSRRASSSGSSTM
jgi:hypothetical protein